jgi:membrane-associated protease RseP (regulator of RpoE activity)
MKPQRVLAAIVICVVLSMRLLADESGKTGSTENVSAPTGRLTFVAPDLTEAVNAGQFLAAITFTNQLGIEVAPVEPPLRAHLGLTEGQGVVVTSAAGEGETAKDVLKPHDIVLSIDGHQIASSEKFHELAGSRQGKEAVLQVLRKAKPVELKLTFPNRPVYQLANQHIVGYDFEAIDNQYRIGVTLAQADDVLRSQLRLADGEGLVITDVVADGPSAKAGIRKHDVLVKLDGKRLTAVDAFNAQIQEIKDRKVTATLFRGGRELSLEIAPQLSTQLTDLMYLSTVRLNGINADQRWRVNLNTTGLDSVHVQPVEVHWYSDLQRFMSTDPAATGNSVETTAANSPAEEQIAQLKRQLAEMQKALSALEATLGTKKAEQPSPQPTEQKPEQQTDKPQP